MLLDFIHSPIDIKKMSQDELISLCQELRDEIVHITMQNGGHLGSNLGAVELIVAMHHVFDSPRDKFIFDVGHQSYTHKFLTNRQHLMKNLRQENGTTGFPNREESEHDAFIAGHASTSLSASIGIAKGRDLNNENFNIICFIGDGALSGGMIYEALNNVANIKNFIIILNDNQMSISQSVGAMKKYLAKLLASKTGLILRKKVKAFLLKYKIHFLERFIKKIIFSFNDWNIFEEFGLQYLGPVDGHNLKDLIALLQNTKNISNQKPVIIHAITQKGKGYDKAEEDEANLHGVGKILSQTYTDVFEQHIAYMAESDDKIVAITAAMKTGTGLSLFASKFPQRFFDVGIAEEHAVTFAAGLATQGFKPYVAIYSTFLQRSFDQIYHDVVLQNLSVRFIIDKAGFPGADGQTHAGIYDIAMFQNFDNITILSPSSKQELISMLDFSQKYDKGPLAIRFPKAAVGFSELYSKKTFSDKFSDKFNIVLENSTSKVLILSIGNILSNVLEAIEISKTFPTVIDVRFIKPFCFDEFNKIAANHKYIYVLEEGIFSGFSSMLSEHLIKTKRYDILSKINFLTASRTPTKNFSQKMQQHAAELSVSKIADIIKNIMKKV